MSDRLHSFQGVAPPIPLGELLVRHGRISNQQRDAILAEQANSSRPFGQLAEEMFGVETRDVELAWAEQFASMTEWIDPSAEPIDPMVKGLVSKRQAWQFQLLPIGYDGIHLMLCTTKGNLARALRFSSRSIVSDCYFVLARPEDLGQALMRHYPMDGMTAACIAA